MPVAFVIMTVDVGSLDVALNEVKGIEDVKEVYGTYGYYDLVARVEAEDMGKLKDVVDSKLKRLGNAGAVSVMIVRDET
jgi:DNA-binding Lrp family transcriptional regulator